MRAARPAFANDRLGFTHRDLAEIRRDRSISGNLISGFIV